MEQRARRSTFMLAAALLCGLFMLRLALFLQVEGFVGVDGGAYLLSALRVMGLETTGTDFERPPLAPGWLLAPFIRALPDTLGFNLYSALFSMPIVIAAWWVGSRLISPRAGLVLGLLVGLDPVLTGMVVTGVVPLVGFSMVLLACYGIWTQRWAYVVLSIPLIALTNQTAAGLALIVLPLQWMMVPGKRQNALAMAVGAIAALSVLPWYLDATPGSGKLTYPGPFLSIHPWWDWQVWFAFIPIAVLLTVYKQLDTAAPWARAAAYTIAALTVLQMFQSQNEVVQNLTFRATYLLMPFLWLVVVYFHRQTAVRWWQTSRRAVPMTAVVLALLIGSSVQQFQDQAWLSGFGDANIIATIDEIPDDAGTIVVNAYSMGLYVAAQAQKQVYWTNYMEPPPAYSESDHIARCTLGWVEGCTLEPGVTHVLVDEKWPIEHPLYPQRAPYGAPDSNIWDTSRAPWLHLIAENGTTKLYEVRS